MQRSACRASGCNTCLRCWRNRLKHGNKQAKRHGGEFIVMDAIVFEKEQKMSFSEKYNRKLSIQAERKDKQNEKKQRLYDLKIQRENDNFIRWLTKQLQFANSRKNIDAYTTKCGSKLSL